MNKAEDELHRSRYMHVQLHSLSYAGSSKFKLLWFYCLFENCKSALSEKNG